MTKINIRPKEQGFLARTLAGLVDLWEGVAGAEAVGALGPDLPGRDVDAVRVQMQDCLAGKGGDVSARKRAAALGQAYLQLSETGKRRFLSTLAEDFGVSDEEVSRAILTWEKAESDADRTQAAGQLRAALTAPRTILLRQFNDLPQGVKFLVDMRADILRFVKDTPLLAPLDDDLQALLIDWFDIGFLELKSISWRSPASLLEKLIEYEAVHEIRSWQDLRNRLESDRRLFAFFHPRMPEEPLIFVEVALVNGMAGSIQDLLDENAPTGDPEKADTAIFYSISNTQKGLRGISFGNFLIKRVVDGLRADLPNLKTFATLSPIPGFMRWLQGAGASSGQAHFLPAEKDKLSKVLGRPADDIAMGDIFADPDWPQDAKLKEVLQGPALRLCAKYLIQEKRGKLPLDPVARFHLTNGAQVERLNWLGDVSEKGLRDSAGIMVNYMYQLSDIERNHERFQSDGTVSTSSTVKSLL